MLISKICCDKKYKNKKIKVNTKYEKETDCVC